MIKIKRNKKNGFILSFLKFLSGLFVFFCSLLLFLLILFKIYIMKFKSDVMDLNMEAARLSQVSLIYMTNSRGFQKEYQRLSGTDNRIWVDFFKIPKYMKDAIISIEDKRFYSHNGIDFIRTFGAVTNKLLGRSGKGGGSTLTQQLIKNITADSEITTIRKIREMARAIRLEEYYSKDEILEVYLNIVNFGAGARGVQAASRIYFNKNIWDCTIPECACIAAITQNPTFYNPLVNPENNKRRRNIIIKEMKNQNKISESEYQNACKESEIMKFKKHSINEENTNSPIIKNWYIESMCKEIINDLTKKYNIKQTMAKDILYSGGLKIYSAIDDRAQKICEDTLLNQNIMFKDKAMELGFMMMDYSGRILAMIGSSKPKLENFIFDRCQSKRQPGSTIKPISVYAPCIDMGLCHYSSIVSDMPLQIDVNGDGNIKDWPLNWYNEYRGDVTVQWALEKSANAPAAQLLNKLGTQQSFLFLTQKLKFSNLDKNDAVSFSALATGGTHQGVTVREMVGAFGIFGNEGKFVKPYTYSYVTDKEDRVILDNRNDPPKIVISPQTAQIMRGLLREIIIGPEGTGRNANIDKIEVLGKTGTTNNDYDSWFIGLTPYAVAGIWTGFDTPKTIKETSAAAKIWKAIMNKYISDKPVLEFKKDENVVLKEYCQESGQIATNFCTNKKIGYYDINLIPDNCHIHTN